MGCIICPRKCNCDRSKSVGFCGMDDNLTVALATLHFGEEPCISGKRGSGTIFFSGCNLKCVYCQNCEISSKHFGEKITVKRLSEIFKELVEQGAHNINLVTPTHFSTLICQALDIYHPNVPIVYNTSGYESEEAIEKLSGYVDIFLTDLKYMDSNLSSEYSSAKDYFDVSFKAIKKMRDVISKDEFDDDGMMKKGVIIRHLVLPNCTQDSLNILDLISKEFPGTLVSLMGQYTPCYKAKDILKLNRPLKPIEYKIVLNRAEELNLKGYCQDLSSEGEYIPTFDLRGIRPKN